MVKPDQQVCDPAVLPTEIQQKSGGGGGWGWGGTGSREVERLLLSFSKSTVNNAGNYRGRQNRRREGERREEEGKYCSPVPNKYQTAGKSQPFRTGTRREL